MPGTMPVTLDPRVYRAAAQEKPRCRSGFRLQVPKNCNMALDTCTRSEGMAHKITQADKTQRMGTRTKSFRTLSTILSEPVRSDPQHLYALGASWPRRRQTSRQYRIRDMQTHTHTSICICIRIYTFYVHTYIRTYTQCICPLFSFLGSTAGRQTCLLVRHQGCLWSAHVNAPGSSAVQIQTLV